MLRFVMYTVIEALIPVTNMVITVVCVRSDIIAIHREMLNYLQQGSSSGLISAMDELLDYLLAKFEQARKTDSENRYAVATQVI